VVISVKNVFILLKYISADYILLNMVLLISLDHYKGDKEFFSSNFINLYISSRVGIRAVGVVNILFIKESIVVIFYL